MAFLKNPVAGLQPLIVQLGFLKKEILHIHERIENYVIVVVPHKLHKAQ